MKKFIIIHLYSLSTKFTKEYQKNSDCCIEFIEEHIQITNEKKDIVQLSTVMSVFREWYKDMYAEKAPGRKVLKPYLEKYFNTNMSSFGWRYAKLIYNQNNEIIIYLDE